MREHSKQIRLREEKERQRQELEVPLLPWRHLLLVAPSSLAIGPSLGISFAGVGCHTSTSPSSFDWVVKEIQLEFITLSYVVWRACEVASMKVNFRFLKI